MPVMVVIFYLKKEKYHAHIFVEGQSCFVHKTRLGNCCFVCKILDKNYLNLKSIGRNSVR